MPPPTPRMMLFGATARRNLVRILGQDFVLHQAPADLFHGDNGRFLGRGGQKRTGAILQLPRALGGDNDEAVNALLGIVGNRAVGVILWSLFGHRYKPHKILLQTSPGSAGFAVPFGPGASAPPAQSRPASRRKTASRC